MSFTPTKKQFWTDGCHKTTVDDYTEKMVTLIGRTLFQGSEIRSTFCGSSEPDGSIAHCDFKEQIEAGVEELMVSSYCNSSIWSN